MSWLNKTTPDDSASKAITLPLTFFDVCFEIGPPVTTVDVINAATADPKNVKIIIPMKNHTMANSLAMTPFGQRSP